MFFSQDQKRGPLAALALAGAVALGTGAAWAQLVQVDIVPDQPPRLSRIQVAAPDEERQATVKGSAGAVFSNGHVLLVNLASGHWTTTTASANGSFTATLFAPAGTSILVKADPDGRFVSSLVAAGPVIRFHASQLVSLPGTIVRVPNPISSAGVAFGGAGLVTEAHLPVWTFKGALSRQAARRGEKIEITGTLNLISESLPDSPLQVDAFLTVTRLTLKDGTPATDYNHFGSSLLTATGLPIERTYEPECRPLAEAHSALIKNKQGAQAEVVLSWTVPEFLPEGMYRPVLQFGFPKVPGQMPDKQQIFTFMDNARQGPRVHTTVMLPVLKIGDVQPPRLVWTLLTDTFSNGTRGTRALEDQKIFALSSRVLTHTDVFVVPQKDPTSGKTLKYRLEPFAPALTLGDRGSPPHAPWISFRFPSGAFKATIRKPDGAVQVLGPAAFLQDRLRGPADPLTGGAMEGGGSIADAYQLTTLDPVFEVEFDQQGRHIISLEGSIEDIWGNLWTGKGTYEIYVGRYLSLDTAVMPGTPFEIGDAFHPGLSVTPAVPADITVKLELAAFSDASRIRRWEIRGRANRFGYFSPALDKVAFEEPGEYRVDYIASFRAEDGTLWIGARTWGSAVVPQNPSIVAHGKRGLDDLPSTVSQWFFRTSTGIEAGDSHLNFPFSSGDVLWMQKNDSTIPAITFQDLAGDIAERFRQTQCAPGVVHGRATLAERLAAGEGPLFSAGVGGFDPQLDLSTIPLWWGYSYVFVERPLVRVREVIGDVGPPAPYWRFRDRFAGQLGNGANGDLLNDFKFQFGAAVIRGPALPEPKYAAYGSLFVLVPSQDPGGGTRVFPPFQGNGGGPSGGPIMTLKGKDIEIFFHPTALRPGSILETGDLVSFAGQIGPMLPAKLEISVESPSGQTRRITGQANEIGYYYDPLQDFAAGEPGVWKAKVRVWFDGQTSAGQVTEPYPEGDVLGSRQGEFSFYVIEPDSEMLDLDIAEEGVLKPAAGPIPIAARGQNTAQSAGTAQWVGQELTVTAMMPGFILQEKTESRLTYEYDAPTLAQEFPNLDLWDADGRAGADLVSISLMAKGRKPDGKTAYRARQIGLRGEELVALSHRSPLEGFGQFANGSGIRSDLILVNPSPRQAVRARALLSDSQGRPLPVSINGQAASSDVKLEVASLGTGFFETTGTGDLQSGSVRLTSNTPLGGTILFSGSFGVAGVAMVRPARHFLVPVQSDADTGVSTGVALANPGDAAVGATVRLRRANGALIATKSIELPVRGQLARFPQELFPAQNFSEFEGSLEIDSPAAIIGMAIRISPSQFATLPVTSTESASRTLRFGHFGSGQGIVSTVVLVNPWQEAVKGRIEFYRSDGSSLTLGFNGQQVTGGLDFSIAAKGVLVLSTDPSQQLQTGWIEVNSLIPLGGTLLFSGDFGVAGVGNAEAERRFLVPIESKRSLGVETGLALSNPNSAAVPVSLVLRNASGQAVENGSTNLELPARGHCARFAHELFAGAAIDWNSFRGSIEVRAAGAIVGMAQRVSPGEFATLPVTRAN